MERMHLVRFSGECLEAVTVQLYLWGGRPSDPQGPVCRCGVRHVVTLLTILLIATIVTLSCQPHSPEIHLPILALKTNDVHVLAVPVAPPLPALSLRPLGCCVVLARV